MQVGRYEFELDPLMICMAAGCVASNTSQQKEKFTNILEKSAPYVLLPFFTLTGASLALDKVMRILPAASLIASSAASLSSACECAATKA